MFPVQLAYQNRNKPNHYSALVQGGAEKPPTFQNLTTAMLLQSAT